jgi:hypothetical protein
MILHKTNGKVPFAGKNRVPMILSHPRNGAFCKMRFQLLEVGR